ncbi:epsin homolog lqf isoform X2 [Lycorma delicatula]|uniref:epsin homolog lqf isoform X2 n=1 Tax=Lycorma delicatula TaxID=130591 RepID=UPI003F510932
MNLNFAFTSGVTGKNNSRSKMRRQREDMQVNVAGLRRNIKNLAHNYSDAQVKVREATSNDPWGPSSTLMSEIADLTYNVVAFTEIMQMIWKRLNDHGRNWRHVYKALVLLEYLIKTGSEKVALQCKENIFAIQTLRDFQYCDEGKDQGLNVREKAKQLVSLLKDDEKLRNERARALKAKERFAQTASGFGSDTGLDTVSPSSPSYPGFRESWRNSCDTETPTRGTVGEEELQLQLALAMSREEAEQEEQKRRSDDVRLQLALSQSENEFRQHQTQPKESTSHMLDLLDVNLGTPTPPPVATVDPWGMPQPAPQPAVRPQTLDIMYSNWDLTDPWSVSSTITSATSMSDPWAPVANQPVVAKPVPAAANDPWKSVTTRDNTVSPGPRVVATCDPWSPATDVSPSHSLTSPPSTALTTNTEIDEFDFISKRGSNVNNANSLNNNRIEGTTSPDPFDLSEINDTLSTVTAPKKTPHSFLGENSALVNLDNLVTKPVAPTNQPTLPVPPAALANPFSTGIVGAPTNQSLFHPVPPSYNTTDTTTGTLPQPLMPQPNPFLS